MRRAKLASGLTTPTERRLTVRLTDSEVLRVRGAALARGVSVSRFLVEAGVNLALRSSQRHIVQSHALAGLTSVADGVVACVVTSPPYWGMTTDDPATRVAWPDALGTGSLGAERDLSVYTARLVAIFRAMRRTLTTRAGVWLVLRDTWGDRRRLHGVPWRVADALAADGWCVRAEVIWHRGNAVAHALDAGHSRPPHSHDIMLLIGKSDRVVYEQPAGQAGSVWMYGHDRPASGHPCPLPVALTMACIASTSPAGGLVLDPFAGSGSVGVGAVQLGRDFLGIEPVAAWVADAERRIAAV
jgi:site-specific DNA-methyltransferase (adenine-specific)